MKKIMTFSAVTAIVFAVVLTFSTQNAVSNDPDCIAYSSKYKENETGDIYKCKYSTEKNVFVCGTSNKNFRAFLYKNISDFIKERKAFGRGYRLKMARVLKDYNHEITYSYDTKGRLVKEESNILRAVYTEWDSKGRNTKGNATLLNHCENSELTSTYDDANRTETHVIKNGVSKSKFGCGSFPTIMKMTYDSKGNVISMYYEFIDGKKKISNYTLMEFEKVCSGK